MNRGGACRLRIVITGLAATFPLGGVFWDYFQYVEGLRGLGHEVLYLEDTGKWCYDAEAQTFVENGARNAAWLARAIRTFEPALADFWYFRDPAGNDYGRTFNQAAAFCRDADLLLDISASCRMCEEYLRARRIAFIDSDPMYTQACVSAHLEGNASAEERAALDKLRMHQVFFTFAENVAAPQCRVPRQFFNWMPTRQPIVLKHFDNGAARVPLAARRRALTTVMSWEPAEHGPRIDGVNYFGKSAEFERYIDLPATVTAPLEIALSGPAPRERIRRYGWHLRDAYEISADPWTYRAYLANSFAEWSVAKDAYVRSASGWFSCRSACYLSLGVPVIVQDTGFGCALPSGEGVLAFSTADQARAAVEAVLANPHPHARAAVAIAREYFDSGPVLTRLLDAAM
ncbi:MAG: glycosyltransferase family 1 protein [Candidatus Binataceae bacterium]